jgi:hypothetical protein
MIHGPGNASTTNAVIAPPWHGNRHDGRIGAAAARRLDDNDSAMASALLDESGYLP